MDANVVIFLKIAWFWINFFHSTTNETTIQVSYLGKNQDITMATKFADIAKGPKGK